MKTPSVALVSALVAGALLVGCSEDKHEDSKACESGCIKTVAGKVLRGPAEGPVDTVAFTLPKGVAAGTDGRIYVADAGANQIRVIADGQVKAFAGVGERGFGDGHAAQARFAGPSSLAQGQDGTLYVADQGNHRIRAIKDGVVTTLSGGDAGFADGPVAAARFSQPTGVLVDTDGSLLVVDFGNHRIRRIADGAVTTVAGTGKPEAQLGAPLATGLTNPYGAAREADGSLLITDLGNQRLLRWTGDAITLVAGAVDPKTKKPLAESKDGPLAEAAFNGPASVAVAPKGIVVTDWWGDRVRLVADGKVTTIVGIPKESSKDLRYLEGPLGESLVKAPFSLAILPDGHLLLADSGNRRVCVLDL